MADPLLNGEFPTKGLYQALAIAPMCLQEEASTRPVIGDVVTTLEYLAISNAGQSSENTEQIEGNSSHQEPRADGDANKSGDDMTDHPLIIVMWRKTEKQRNDVSIRIFLCIAIGLLTTLVRDYIVR